MHTHMYMYMCMYRDYMYIYTYTCIYTLISLIDHWAKSTWHVAMLCHCPNLLISVPTFWQRPLHSSMYCHVPSMRDKPWQSHSSIDDIVHHWC